ncbi:hypothetical protein FRB99_005857 [Tulasnella sp. 403]|nr:hypothetical protein FRB99_005857 [Tulasnella sp. 403]
MSSNQEVLQEEFEVLESIYPDELEKLSDVSLQISVAPEEQVPGDELRVMLHVEYPPDYPDVTPALSMSYGEYQLFTHVARESLGMAQTFTIVSALVEGIASTVQQRIKQKQDEKAKKDREEEEAEQRRLRGTPVTSESFATWRTKFLRERAATKALQEDEKMKDLSNKEKEEYKKIATRLTGRQLFERNRDLATSDDTLVEEGAQSVDFSQYSREEAQAEESKEEERLYFSDSD